MKTKHILLYFMLSIPLWGYELTKSEKERLDDYYNSQILHYFDRIHSIELDEVFLGEFFRSNSIIFFTTPFWSSQNCEFDKGIILKKDSRYINLTDKNIDPSMVNKTFKVKSENDLKVFSAAFGTLFVERAEIDKILYKDGKWLILNKKKGESRSGNTRYISYYGYSIETDSVGTIIDITFPNGGVRLEKK